MYGKPSTLAAGGAQTGSKLAPTFPCRAQALCLKSSPNPPLFSDNALSELQDQTENPQSGSLQAMWTSDSVAPFPFLQPLSSKSFSI